jgi:hypothetical protein
MKLKLNPSIVIGALTALVALVVAFGAPLSENMSAAILTLGGGLATLLFAHGITNVGKYLSPQTISGLVAETIGVAVAFGLPITTAQTTALLTVVTVISGLLVSGGVIHTAVAASKGQIGHPGANPPK